MNKLQFLFSELYSDVSFSNLSFALEAELGDRSIRIPAWHGKGEVKRIDFEEGFHMKVWNLQLNKPIVFRKISDDPEAEKTYTIVFMLQPDSLTLKSKSLGKDFRVQEGVNIMFISSDSEMDFEVDADKMIRSIELSVSSSWMMQAFKEESEMFLSFVAQLNSNPNPTLFLDSSTAVEYRVLADLHTACVSESKSNLYIKAGALSLLSDFFGKVFSRSSDEVLESKILYHDKMIEVERILANHLQKTLPSIESIAWQVALSESTLKRHFKLMFNKSIYEYYLHMKMDYAKRLLLERPLTVNEVAAMLDYEKVSNFIGMFKKHHGFSPGSIRKNTQLK